MRYEVAKGWRLKGSDGRRHLSGEIIPLLDQDVDRLLKHGAVVARLDIEEEGEEAGAADGEDDDNGGEEGVRPPYDIGLIPGDNGEFLDGPEIGDDGAGEHDAAGMNRDAERISDTGGDISGAVSGKKPGKSTKPAAKKPKE